MESKTISVAAGVVVVVMLFSFVFTITRDSSEADIYGSQWDDIPTLDRVGMNSFDRTVVYQRNVWGIENPQQFFVVEDAPTNQAQTDNTAEPSDLDIRLLGIVSENQTFLALLQVNDAEVTAFSENMELGEYRIQSIDKTRVVIVKKDQNETLTLFEQ